MVGETARQVTANATNPYEQAVALQDYFAVTGGFEYDTQVQVGSGSQAIARFLRDKQGFCVHFSFAMAAMARSWAYRRGSRWVSHPVPRRRTGRCRWG